MAKAIIKDIEIHYIDKGRGEVVFLIHGNFSSSAWWKYTLDIMKDEYRFIAPDLRGRGATRGTSGGYTIEMLADDLFSLVSEVCDGDPVHLVGHSLGGNVALQYALEHVEKVKSIILLNPGWVAGDIPDKHVDIDRLKSLVEDKDAIKTILRKVVAPNHPENETWDDFVSESLKQSDEATMQSGEAFKRWKVVKELHRLKDIPTCVVRGAGDNSLSTEKVCKTIVEAIPGAQYHEIMGATHAPNIEAPCEWTNLLREFLKSAA